MQVFVIHHFHVVALLCAHRNASTPSEKDLVLASKLTDPAKMQKSVEHAEAEAVLLEKPRKRLRRMAEKTLNLRPWRRRWLTSSISSSLSGPKMWIDM